MYLADIEVQKTLQNDNCRAIFLRRVEFEALYGTHCSWCKFKHVQ